MFTDNRNVIKINKGVFAYMKATGIVRRIDDLGRVVIPKEIRRTMRIREGDPLLTTLTQIDLLLLNLTSICKRKLEIEEKRKEYEERERRIKSWLNA